MAGGVAPRAGARRSCSSADAAASAATEAELADVEVAGGEAGFAVSQVELPGAPERFVEAVRADGLPVGGEPVSPAAERLGVVGTEPVVFPDRQCGVLRQRLVDRGPRGNDPAREDVFL